MAVAFANPVDLQTRLGNWLKYEHQRFDDDGYERTERVNGSVQCPRCELWWPCVEEPEEWVDDNSSSMKYAVSWWGGVVCCECQLLIVDQPDGRVEVYKL